jgi:PAS domain S-box-containing protein
MREILKQKKLQDMNDQTSQTKDLLADTDYKALLAAVSEAALISVTNAEGDIIYVNDKFVEICKYSRTELIGQNHRILKSGHQSNNISSQLWSTISQGKIWRGKIKNKAKDGSYYWADTSIAPVIDHTGKAERYVSVGFLIVDKTQIEQDLENQNRAMLNVMEDLEVEKNIIEKEKAKDEAILTNIGDAVIVVDKQGLITFANKTFEESMKLTLKDVIGKKMVDVVPKFDENNKLIPPETRSVSRVLSGQVFQGRVSTLLHSHYYKRSDGTQMPIVGIVTPIVINDNIEGAIQVFHDITNEKQIDKAKTEFISLASHQLRTPLSTINWYCEMLLDGDAGAITDDQRKETFNKYFWNSCIPWYVRIYIPRLCREWRLIKPRLLNLSSRIYHLCCSLCLRVWLHYSTCNGSDCSSIHTPTYSQP